MADATYTAAIEGDALASCLTRHYSSYIATARAVASEGRAGETISVYGPKGERRFRTNALGLVDRVQ